MKDRIINSKGDYKDFDKYVNAIGLPQLMNWDKSDIIAEIEYSLNTNKHGWRIFANNTTSFNRMDYNIISYGAGSSFLGVLQEVARGNIKVEAGIPKNRKLNLWDDQFGCQFKLESNCMALGNLSNTEEIVIDTMNRDSTWRNLWGNYIQQISVWPSNNVQANFHCDPITLPFFIPLELMFLLNLDHETFVWCYFLAYMKHESIGNVGSRAVKNFMDGNITNIKSLYSHLARCNAEYNIFCLSKKYGLEPKCMLNYKSLIVNQDRNEIKKFLELTEGAETSEFMIDTVADLLKQYHKENLKIMKDWDERKQQILDYKWTKTYE